MQPKEGHFILNGKGSIGDHKVQPITEKIDNISLRFNPNENMWYCDYMLKDKVIGSIPCKDIICDVPFIGKVDKNHEKPKVTAELKKKDILGTSMALNAMIIKKK